MNTKTNKYRELVEKMRGIKGCVRGVESDYPDIQQALDIAADVEELVDYLAIHPWAKHTYSTADRSGSYKNRANSHTSTGK